MVEKNKKTRIIFICDKCGKEMPVDREKSTDQWIVCDVKCPCGGRGEIKILND